MPCVDINTSGAEAKLWLGEMLLIEGQPIAAIGGLRFEEAKVLPDLFRAAAKCARENGCRMLVGPMDGNTWRRYRATTETDGSPPFFLESPYGPEVARAFLDAGATVLATYFSARTVRPKSRCSEELGKRLEKLVFVRPLVSSNGGEFDLRAMHGLCLKKFQKNFLYTPISEAEFIEMYRPIVPKIPPENVLLAETPEGVLKGFVFAVPNFSVANPQKELIVKTYASDLPGLGGWLVDKLQHGAQKRGVESFIHALMHEDNVSLNNSAHYARPFRTYALFKLDTAHESN